MRSFFVFLAILTFNLSAVFWISANPSFMVAVGEIVDMYVFPAVLAFSFSIFCFWLWAKLHFLSKRLRGEGWQ